MWSAGLLTYHVTTGRPVKSTGEPPDLSVRGTALQSLLDGVFVSSAADRPTGTKLLSRLRVADPWPDGNNSVDPRFAEGGRIFDELLQAKFPTVPISPARADRNRHGRRQRANRWAGWIIAITVVIIILVGILLWARIK